MTADERAAAFVEQHATGVDTNTFGFDAWQFKGWLVAAIRDAEEAMKERCAAVIESEMEEGNPDNRVLEEMATAIREMN